MLLIGNIRSDNRGYTLIEILIVLLIMGISLSVIAPSMAGYMDSVEVKTEQRQIINLLVKVRKEAITSSEKQVIDITNKGLVYDPQNGERYILDTKFELINTTNSNLIFNPDGTTNGTIITLRYDGKQYRVEVDGITGQISWSEN